MKDIRRNRRQLERGLQRNRDKETIRNAEKISDLSPRLALLAGLAIFGMSPSIRVKVIDSKKVAQNNKTVKANPFFPNKFYSDYGRGQRKKARTRRIARKRYRRVIKELEE